MTLVKRVKNPTSPIMFSLHMSTTEIDIRLSRAAIAAFGMFAPRDNQCIWANWHFWCLIINIKKQTQIDWTLWFAGIQFVQSTFQFRFWWTMFESFRWSPKKGGPAQINQCSILLGNIYKRFKSIQKREKPEVHLIRPIRLHRVALMIEFHGWKICRRQRKLLAKHTYRCRNPAKIIF